MKKEIQRCKEIVERKIDAVIRQREKLKRKKGRNISQLERLKENILFLIDNPDYENKT